MNKVKQRSENSKRQFTAEQKGGSLIEILVTLMIMAVGLLGLASIQMISIKNINNSQFRSLATAYAYDMAERMRSNRAAVNEYDGIDTADVTNIDCSTACTSAQIAQMDGYQWAEEITQSVISGGLPTGKGIVSNKRSGGVATNVFDIKVTWKEQGRNADGGIVSGASFTLAIQL